MADTCAICKSVLQRSEDFDLKNLTLCSKRPLLLVLQNCIETAFSTVPSAICKTCFLLLEEFENISIRSQTIREKLQSCIQEKIAKDEPEYVEYLEQVATPDLHQNKSDGNIETFHCSQCPKLCKNESALTKHMNTHYIEAQLSGNKNNQESDTHEIENTHTDPGYQENKNVENNKTFQCSQCPKLCKSKTDLSKHMKAHTKDRPFICEICGQGYKQKKALDVHVGMHLGVNLHTCSYCNKSFTQKGGLVRHLPIHTGQRPYQCELCGKRFTHHTSFDIHKKGHDGVKEFKCDVCGLLLISTSHLSRHKRIHTGEKRYACEICGKKFTERYNLVAHEKLHAGVASRRKHRCGICNKVFTREALLETHLLNAHENYKLSHSITRMEQVPEVEVPEVEGPSCKFQQMNMYFNSIQ